MSAPRDRLKLAAAFSAPEQSSRIRFGQVISVQPATNTCTITVAGSASSIAGVKYVIEPAAGSSCIVMTDGADMFVLGQAGVSVPLYDATARRSTDTGVPAGAGGTAIAFESVDGDSYAHWSAAAPTILTIKREGAYLCTGAISFSGVVSSTGWRAAAIIRNTSTSIARTQVMAVTTSGIATSVTVCSPIIQLAVGDTIGLTGFQTHSATLQAQGSVVGGVWLSIARVGA